MSIPNSKNGFKDILVMEWPTAILYMNPIRSEDRNLLGDIESKFFISFLLFFIWDWNKIWFYELSDAMSIRAIMNKLVSHTTAIYSTFESYSVTKYCGLVEKQDTLSKYVWGAAPFFLLVCAFSHDSVPFHIFFHSMFFFKFFSSVYSGASSMSHSLSLSSSFIQYHFLLFYFFSILLAFFPFFLFLLS